MNLIKPKRLNLGDTIGIIAPAGCVENEEKAMKAKFFFENLGYKIVFGKNIFNKNNYLAGSDEQRLEDLHAFFADENINAIFCLRGGYGSLRLINKIDYELIRKNPKFFAGYSDITALCIMFLKRSGLITYHAPLFQSDFGTDKPSNYTFAKFLNAYTHFKNEEIKSSKVYKTGNAQGILLGGNLSTITSLCGINFVPNEKFIFFAEDLNEPVYKIDKMFTQLLNINEFKENIQGLILGDFLRVDDKNYLEDLFKELAQNLNIPVLGGFKITHKKDKLTIPVGANAKIKDNKFYFEY
ncbi:LD-carboxypeptidase [bacterium]|nr:LD-carboxypeptidase [bacterium]